MSKKKNSKTTKKILKAKKLYSVNINGEFAVTNKKGTKALLKLICDANYERYDKENETASDKLGTDISENPYSYQNEKERFKGAYSPWMFNYNVFPKLEILMNTIPIDTFILDENLYGDFMVNELFGVTQNSDGITEVYDTTIYKLPGMTPMLVVNNIDDEYPDMKLGIRINNHSVMVTDRVLPKYTKLTIKVRKGLISFTQRIRSINGFPTKTPITVLIRDDDHHSIPFSVTGLNLLYDDPIEESEEGVDKSTSKTMKEKLLQATPSEIEENIKKGTFYGAYGDNRMKEMVDKDQILVDVNHMHSDILVANDADENFSYEDSTSDSEITKEKATNDN